MKNHGVLGLSSLCIVLLLSVGASADLIVYEGFDMVGVAENAQITGLAGATSFGWAENFRMNSSAGAAESARFVGTSLTGKVSTPKTRGGSIIQTVNNSRFYRNFTSPLGPVNGTYYVSFLMSAGQNIALDLSNGDWNSNVKASVGIGDTTSGSVTLKVGSSSSAALAPQNEIHFYVLKLNLTSSIDTISIFVDPQLSVFEPAVANAVLTTSGFSVDRIRFGKYNSNTYSYFDEFRIGESYADVVPVPGAAVNVAPKDEAINVPLTSVLEWQVGNDPNEVNGILPWEEVAGYYVYLGTNPNQLVLQTHQAQTTTTFDPVLANDTVYYWQIVETFDNGQGGLYGPTDPNNVFGPVWFFQTPLSVPVITQNPEALIRTAVSTTVQFQVAVESASTPHYAWFYSADTVLGGDSAVGTDSAVLTLNNVQLANQGYYYCVVSNSSGLTATSTMAQLVINRLLAHYPFENSLDDVVGANDAAPAGSPMAYAGGIVTDDGQTYAADPNGGMYGLLPTGCYPKAGVGNGLDLFTYSAWVKLADSTCGKHLMGQLNSGYTTAMRLSINISGYDISFYMRNNTNTTSLVADKGGLNIADNQWHLVAVSYNGSQAVVYFDGLAVMTVNSSISGFADWEFPFPLLAINSRGSLGEAFKGGVDDFRIYNYALTAENIAQMYYNGTHEKVCFYGKPASDLSGNCIVDLADFAIIAEDWLTNGFYPN